MIYICQISPNNIPKFWSCENEAEAMRLCDVEADDLDEAILHDKRFAYHTDDIIDLFIWTRQHVEVRGLSRAYFSQFDWVVEGLASEEEDPDDEFETIWRAFDGRFLFRDGAWTLDGGEPVEAPTLAEAMCNAAYHIATTENIKSRDA